MEALIFISENIEAVVAAAAAVVAILQLTSWGRANKQALHDVIAAIENVGKWAPDQRAQIGSQYVKREVEQISRLQPLRVQEVLADAVALVDTKHKRPTVLQQIGRFIVPIAVRNLPRLIGRIFKR